MEKKCYTCQCNIAHHSRASQRCRLNVFAYINQIGRSILYVSNYLGYVMNYIRNFDEMKSKFRML